MKTRPEGFLWFRSGEIDDRKSLRENLSGRLPKFFGDRDTWDFQVLDDTLWWTTTPARPRWSCA